MTLALSAGFILPLGIVATSAADPAKRFAAAPPITRLEALALPSPA